ncbi:hypothetical protein PWT90_04282 [Aphanocladium album]|nr:hypothetical protein PWT90_04282 [Aphanocladium album]
MRGYSYGSAGYGSATASGYGYATIATGLEGQPTTSKRPYRSNTFSWFPNGYTAVSSGKVIEKPSAAHQAKRSRHRAESGPPSKGFNRVYSAIKNFGIGHEARVLGPSTLYDFTLRDAASSKIRRTQAIHTQEIAYREKGGPEAELCKSDVARHCCICCITTNEYRYQDIPQEEAEGRLRLLQLLWTLSKRRLLQSCRIFQEKTAL